MSQANDPNEPRPPPPAESQHAAALPSTTLGEASLATGTESEGSPPARDHIDSPSPGRDDTSAVNEEQSKVDKVSEQLQTPDSARSLRQELLSWKFELVALFLFLAALFAIVGTVFPYKGRPRPDWPFPFRFSINTLLSIYAVVFKAAILKVVGSVIFQTQWLWFAAAKRPLYDITRYQDAGHGELGSIKWLAHYKWRQPVVALAAIVIITAAAIDPFVQQIISYTDCSIDISSDTSVARIPRTSYLSSAFTQGVSESALAASFLGPPADVSAQCSTGNCTFSIKYNSIAYCSFCTDISDQLIITKGVPQGWLGPGSGPGTTTNNTVTLPNGFSLTQENSDVKFNAMAAQFDLNSSFWNVTANIISSAYEQTGINPDTGEPILGCEDLSNNSWLCTGSGAAQCVLTQCVQTYNSTIKNGVLNELLIETSDIKQLPGVAQIPAVIPDTTVILGFIDKQCISQEERQSLAAYSLTQDDLTFPGPSNLSTLNDPTVRWIPFVPIFESAVNLTSLYSSEPPFPESLIAHGCFYGMDGSWPNDIMSYFQNIITDSETKDEGVISAGVSIDGPIGGNQGLDYFGPQVLQQMYNNSYGNSFEAIESVFDNVALSLTNFVRQNGNVNYSAPAVGTALHYSTCIDIQWPWIALPATLAVLSIFLLILAMVSSAKAQAPIWRGSPLVFFFHRNDGEDWFKDAGPVLEQAGKGKLNRTSTMNALAKNITVQLDTAEPLMKLKRVDEGNLVNLDASKPKSGDSS